MASQPTRTGVAPSGQAADVARSVAGREAQRPGPAPERPGPGQPARLRLLPGAGEGAAGHPDPLVAFVGVGDDRRSRLAAALLAYRAGGRVQAVSVSPTEVEPDPVVVRALADIGVDLLGWRPCAPSTELLRRADAVVVMGYDSQTLDGFPRAEDWYIDDLAGKDAETVRYLRDAIDRRVQRLLVRLGGAEPASQREG